MLGKPPLMDMESDYPCITRYVLHVTPYSA